MADLLARIEQLEAKVEAGFAGCREQLEVIAGKIDGRPTGEVPVMESRLVHPSVEPEPKIESITARPEVVGKTEEKEQHLDIFPDKVWVKIFRNLSEYQLSQARLTCRHWNQIIGRSSLMDKLELRFPKGSILDKNCDEVRSLAARYTKVELNEAMIIKAAFWWESFGEHIHTLNLTKCRMVVADLLVMLRNTPKLKCLAFDVMLSSSCPDNVFEVKNLEELTLGESVQHETIALFQKLRLPLKGLSIRQKIYNNEIFDKAQNFIISVRNTLESLSLFGENTSSLLRIVLRTLRLKKFRCSCIDFDLLTSYSEYFPAIAEMNVAIIEREEFFHNAFPDGLTRLELVSVRCPLQFLVESLPQLEHLRIKNSCNNNNTVHFTHQASREHASLEVLELINPIETALCLTSFPNLRLLRFAKSRLNNCNEFLTTCAQLQNLNHLELTEIHTKNDCEDFFDYMENLKVLKLSSCYMSSVFLKNIFALCPNLETVSLKDMAGVNDNVIHIMCQKLKRLASLELISLHKIKNDSVEHIILNCSVIENVKLGRLTRISRDSAMQRLKTHRNLKLVYQLD
uniref:F-box domain-containing protein n=1 Tax=Culex tarsalis TaxID=7177 RepID=A0A1Q3FJ70_CULTA